MKLTKNFDLNEGFLSPDAKCIPIDVMNNLLRLARNLQSLRDYLDEPIHVNSGYRTPEHNKKVDGEKDSQHLKGKAGDIWVHGMTSLELYLTIERLIREGKMEQGGLGIYNTFVHYDIRGHKARWDYRSS